MYSFTYPAHCLIVFGIAMNGLARNFDFFTCITTKTPEALCRMEGHNPTNYGEKYSNGSNPFGHVDESTAIPFGLTFSEQHVVCFR